MKSYFSLLNYEACIVYTYSLSPSVFFLLLHFYLLSEFYVVQQQEARKDQNQGHEAFDNQVRVWPTKLLKCERDIPFYAKMGQNIMNL